MNTFFYNTEQFLRVSIETAWNFFSSPDNLARITPPEMNFKILTPVKGQEIFEGMTIDYNVRPLFRIPLHWQTEIDSVNKPYSFTDKQSKGPYEFWEHTHTFFEKENGILMKDKVKYRLKFGIIGQLIHKILVREKIENIFSYRKEILQKIFNSHGNNS